MRFCFLTFCFILVFNLSSSQTSKLSFHQLSCPEKWWILTHPFVACKAKKITKDAIVVLKEMKNDSLLDRDEAGGQVDAFRHAYWMASLSQKMSWKKALALGRAHEKGDYKKFRKGKFEDEISIPDSISSVMDLYNNNIGADIGRNNINLDKENLKKLIRLKILEGKMKIISKNLKGEFLDCSGKVFDFKLYKGKWYMPKCLVDSNIRTRK